MRNLAELDTMRIELVQGRKELGEERERNARLKKELEEINFDYHINNEHWFRVVDNQRRAEKERKKMEERLAKVVEDWTWAEEVLTATQKRA